MRLVGIEYAGPIMLDGDLHRFMANDDREPNSWYVAYPDNPTAAAFGCWKLGISETWCEKRDSLQPADWANVQRRWQQAETAKKNAEDERRTTARKLAAEIREQSQPCTEHAYLTAKKVGVFGEMRQWKDDIALPLRDINNEIHSFQFIGRDGTKRFLPGGKVSGCFFTLSEQIDGPLLISEGYATAASVHAATGLAAVAALN